jgi:hypothetical protein
VFVVDAAADLPLDAVLGELAAGLRTTLELVRGGEPDPARPALHFGAPDPR